MQINECVGAFTAFHINKGVPMTRMKRVMIITSVLAIGASAPVAFSATTGLKANDAQCFTGTCCYEYQSICNAGGGNVSDYYYKSAGSCKPGGT